jgi:MFS family permease
MLIAGLVSIGGGWALDKYGPKKVTLAMGLFTGFSLIISSQVLTAWQLYISYGVLLALGTGALFAVVNSTTSRWFVKKRGLAVGITSSAGAIGGVILAPFSALLLLQFDWRISFIILGAISLVILVPVSQLMKRDPGEIGLLPDGIEPEMEHGKSPGPLMISQQDGLALSESSKTRQFWFLAMIWLFLAVSVQMVLAHVIPHAKDQGISPIDAAFIISLIGVGAVLGRVIDGRLSDIVGRKLPAITSGIIQVAALISLIFIRDLWMFYVFALFFGYGWGGMGTQVTLLVGDIFGLRSIGANLGAITSGWNVGAAIGPALGGIIYDITGNYYPAFAIAAFGMLLAIIFSVLVTSGRTESMRGH